MSNSLHFQCPYVLFIFIEIVDLAFFFAVLNDSIGGRTHYKTVHGFQLASRRQGAIMRNLTKPNERRVRHTRTTIALVTRLRRDEGGGITIFTLFLLVTMLVLGGMAVDFMRFESKRVLLQSVSDRAVLSAAELDQTRDPDVIVEDFFRTAGYEGAVITRLVTDAKVGNREVEVSSEIDIDTFFLRLVGIDTLTAPALSGAVEGTGKVEVSLILDISGSMRWNATGDYDGDSSTPNTTHTRMAFLQKAATGFIEDLLVEQDANGNPLNSAGNIKQPTDDYVLKYEDQVSVNLIAYSQNVSLGNDLYGALTTTPDVRHQNGISYHYGDPLIPTGNSFRNPSRCVDFDLNAVSGDFTRLDFVDREYQQLEYFKHYSRGSGASLKEFRICPEEAEEGIIPLSQDPDALITAIDAYEPTSFTSIHLGMKWGTLLLDESISSTLASITSIDPAFSGSRPAAYNAANTTKYIVLMTDGSNVQGRRLGTDGQGRSLYRNRNWQQRWSDHSLNDWMGLDGRNRSADWYTDYPTTASEQDDFLQEQCTLAEAENVVIYTIAMGAGAGSNGETQMTNCASVNGGAFSTNFTNQPGEPGIDEIFQTIAKQITALRLSL